MAGEIVRCACYYRMSTDDQKDSIDRQRSTVLPHCERKGYRVTGEYLDEGIAGDEFAKRPGLQRLLAAAAAGEFDVAVVDEVSRLSRQRYTTFVATVAHPLDEAGVTLDSVAEGEIGWDEMADILRMSIYQPTAHGESQKNSRRVLTGMANLARRRLLGGPPPYGYTVHYETVHEPGKPPRLVPVKYVPDPRTARVIPWLFERYASGAAGTAELAQELNARGAPAPARTSRRKGQPPSPFWTHQAVLFILKNPKYTGYLTWNRHCRGKYHQLTNGKAVKPARGRSGYNPAGDWIVTEDAHEPLVSRELFERVQDRLEGNRGGRLRAARNGYLFSGLLVCSHCGRTLSGLTRYGRPVYHCQRKDDAGRVVCGTHQVEQGVMLRLLLGKLQSAFLDPDNLRRLRAEIRRQEEAERQPDRLAGLRRRVEELDRQLSAGAENLLLCPPSVRDRAAAKLAEWERERERLVEELRHVEDHSPVAELEGIVAAAEVWLWKLRDAVERGDQALLRQVVREMVVRVELRWEARPGKSRTFYHLVGGVIVYRFGGRDAFRAEPGSSQGALRAPRRCSRAGGGRP
jgi:DNA invertase Pin-like site-specific DNA recombinase